MSNIKGPAEVLGDKLPTTVVEGSTGWALKTGKLPATPDKVVVSYDSGGSNPWPNRLLDFVMVQFRVRANPGGYAEAYTKAREVKDALLGIPSQTIGSDRWVSVTMSGDIAFMGYDDKDRPEFSLNFRCIIEPAASSLTNRESL